MSTLRTNALEGVDAKNSITIVAGAGNVTTMSVQSGLCKCWCQFDGTGTASITKSFNVSSLSDGGTGDYTVNMTNKLSPNTGPFFATGSTINASDASSDNDGVIRVFTSNEGGTAQDSGRTHTGKFGDLA